MSIDIKIKNLKFHYKGECLLSVPELKCGAGETVCILGANGSGKSLFLECVCGLREYTGEITFYQHNSDSAQIVGHRSIRVGAVLQRSNFWSHVKVKEILHMVKSINGYAITMDQFLDKMKNRYYRHLSAGERQYLFCSVMLGCNTELLVIDEPTMGLDALLHQNILERIQQNSCTKVIALHNFLDALELGKKIYFLCCGTVIELKVVPDSSDSMKAKCELVSYGNRTDSNADEYLLFSDEFILQDQRSVEMMNAKLIPFLTSRVPCNGQGKYVLNLHIPVES